jgi:hypothetical protein
VKPGSSTAEPWIKPDDEPTLGVYGVFRRRKSRDAFDKLGVTDDALIEKHLKPLLVPLKRGSSTPKAKLRKLIVFRFTGSELMRWIWHFD